VYVWKIPDAVYHDPLPGNWVSEAHCVLVGHRSIVNQVRFNRHSMYLISSGVEKVIKVSANVLLILTLKPNCHSYLYRCGVLLLLVERMLCVP
jgi:hypothetical protein